MPLPKEIELQELEVAIFARKRLKSQKIKIELKEEGEIGAIEAKLIKEREAIFRTKRMSLKEY